uniref:Uncharacterized protein n=1 Tax=Strongyloides venezuelensis TaxID=75913 RepID=A0A0K0FJI1_STRVS
MNRITNFLVNEIHTEFSKTNNILTNVSFFFANTNPFLDIPTQKNSKMIEIYGVGIPRLKHVDKGFVEILRTIQSFPDITFIWKYETPEDDHGSGI